MDRQEDIYQALSAYLDGELSESEARRIEERLLDDAALAKELRALRETRDLLRRLPRAQAPEDFADRVLERAERLKLMHAPDDGRQGMGRRLPRLAAAAAILLVAALGVGTVVSLWSVQSFQERMAKREHVAPPKRKADQLAEADESAGGTLTEPVALAIAEKTDAGREAMAEHELRPSSGLLGDERPPKPTVEEPPDYAALKERLIASADQLWQDLSAAGRLLVAGSGGSVLADQPAVAEAATETIDVETVAILTDDLATAQQDVEAALLRNNLEPVLASDWEVRAFPPKVAFAAAEDSPQAQYMVFVEPEQLPKVQVDVVLAAAYRPDNAIRVLNTRAALPPEVARVQAAPAETETLGVEESDRARLRRGRTSGPSEPVIAEGRRAAPAAMFQADEKARAEEPAELKEPGMPAKHRGTVWMQARGTERTKAEQPDRASGVEESAERRLARAAPASAPQDLTMPRPGPEAGTMGERRVVAGVARTEQGLVVWSQRQARPIGIFPDESASTLPASRRLQPLLINLTLRARPAAATAPGETPPPGAAKTE